MNVKVTGLAATALAMLLAGVQAGAAVVVSDFDPGGTYYGGTEGWFPYGTEGMSTVAAPTGGTSTWGDVNASQYGASITAQDWAVPGVSTADWNANTHLEFDIILPGTGPTRWLPNGSATVNVELQTHTGGAGTINKNATPTVDGSIKDAIQHVSIDLSSLQPFALTPNWNLSINLSPGYDYGWDQAGNPGGAIPYDAHWYIDNVQFTTQAVPEPAAAGALALLAGVGATRRWRSR